MPQNSKNGEASSQTLDLLTKGAESVVSANQSFRDAIQLSQDEIGRLNSFEAEFGCIIEKFSRFSESFIDHKKTASDLQLKLQQSIDNLRRSIDDLNSKIIQLRVQNDQQNTENEQLEQTLKRTIDIDYQRGDRKSSDFKESYDGPRSNKILNRLCEE